MANNTPNQFSSYNFQMPLVPINPSTIYDFKNALLKDGAKLNNSKTMVTNLGGDNNGSATIALNMLEGGAYNIYLNFREGPKPFKMDVNGVDTGAIYVTPTARNGVFNTVINLNTGVNIIKLYGDGIDSTSSFGKFTLIKVLPVPAEINTKPYNVADGYLENGAEVSLLTGFVTILGGTSDGSSTLNVTVNKKGKYAIKLEYLNYDVEAIFKIQVNGINIGYYEPPFTDGWTLDDVSTFTFQIDLNAGINEIKFHGNGANPAPDLGRFSLSFINSSLVKNVLIKASYDYASLNTLSFNDLIKVLKTINYNDIPNLYELTPESEQFFGDSNRVEAIINALIDSGKSYTAKNDEGVETLIEVLTAAYSLAYSSDTLEYLIFYGQLKKCFPAIKAVQKNPNFKLVIGSDNKIIKAIASLIKNIVLDSEIINNFAAILDQFKANIKASPNEYKRRDVIFKILNDMDSSMFGLLDIFGNDSKKAGIYGNIDSFLNSLEALSLFGINAPSYTDDLYIKIINFIGKWSKFRKDISISQSILTQCANRYAYFSRVRLEALITLKRYFNGKFSDGSRVDYNKKLEEFKDYYLPNIYNFDDDKFIIRVGKNISEDTIKKLYWAIWEVKSQFFRFTGTNTPVEDGVGDGVLTAIIFNSKEEFKLSYRFYGQTSQGAAGFHLEENSTFITAQFTAKQNLISLEETFRHEFIHHLSTTFLIPGIFIADSSRPTIGDFYANESTRLVWFGEGLSDFFAGSTRKHGIKPRKSFVSKTSIDLVKSIKELLQIKDATLELYITSFAFMYYLYNNHIDILYNINETLRNNDVMGYDMLMENLSKDKLLNENFHRSIEDLIKNLNSLTIPLASNDYLIHHPSKTIEEIECSILNILRLENIVKNTEKSDFFETFILSGTYSAGTSIDKVTDWSNMSKVLDNTLTTLENNSWSGFKTFIAYFTNYSINKYNQVSFNITFHGFINYSPLS